MFQLARTQIFRNLRNESVCVEFVMQSFKKEKGAIILYEIKKKSERQFAIKANFKPLNHKGEILWKFENVQGFVWKSIGE